jgi:hypothetical protein
MEIAPPSRPTGLTRRELERELAWQLRRVPSDPAELVKFLGQVIVTLIDKNNAALARGAGDSDDAGKPGAP